MSLGDKHPCTIGKYFAQRYYLEQWDMFLRIILNSLKRTYQMDKRKCKHYDRNLQMKLTRSRILKRTTGQNYRPNKSALKYLDSSSSKCCSMCTQIVGKHIMARIDELKN
jgi:hypothetical protein